MTSTLLKQVKKSAKEGRIADQTEEVSGFERELEPEGKWLGRFIGYVEMGDRDGGEWKGKKKKPVRKAFVFFQLLSAKLAQEIEVDGEKKTIFPLLRVMVDVKVGEKANLTKLFNAMRGGRDLTHIAEMLGEPFRIEIVHHTKGEGKDAKTYANMRDKDRGWLIGPATKPVFNEDGDQIDEVPVKVREATEPMKLLLWDDPTPEQWDSIKGRPFEYGEKDDKQTFEGGYLQYVCIHDALDFEGSPLQTMLGSGELPDMSPDTLDDEDEGADRPAPEMDDADDELGSADMDFDELDDE